jgi:hypothetical protein
MKIKESVNHDGVQYNYGDEVSAADAKNLPEGYAVSDSEFDKLEEEAEEGSVYDKPASELTEEELANHPAQAPTVPPAVPDEDDDAVSTQPKVATTDKK